MYNSDLPSRAQLPTSAQLIRSTLIAAISALVLLVTVVLPAEYAIDPTGIGRALGLTSMGEIKASLAKEAAEDAASTAQANATMTMPATAPATTAPAATGDTPAAARDVAWRDEASYTLKPGEGIEIKMRMKEGEKARFAWTVQGGVVNFDTHGDGFGRSISYEKGRGVPSDEGELVAAFTGNHGWFFRNRGAADVTLVLRTGGQYQNIKRAQ
jgi:hypothetical protein